MLTYTMFTDQGGRKINEDSVAAVQEKNLLCAALADGLGGHGGGDVASALVAECAVKTFGREKEISCECLGHCFQRGQDELMAKLQSLGRVNEMKSTLTVLATDGERAVWGHIGDSRIYRFTDGRYVMRTKDHSVPQMLVAAGEITEDQIRGHVDRNRLLRVMGIEWNAPKYVISEVAELGEREAFLLCSDGFWEWIEEERMEELLAKAENVQQWMDLMVREVRKNGAGSNMDNFSAVCIIKEGNM